MKRVVTGEQKLVTHEQKIEERFALDKSLVIKLLSSFEGTQIYPEKETKQCSSPSMAAALIAGGPRNGLEFWKTEDGKTMKSFMGEK